MWNIQLPWSESLFAGLLHCVAFDFQIECKADEENAGETGWGMTET